MSLTSLMLAFLPAFIQPKREQDKTAREAELERRVEELGGEIDRLLRLNERAAGRIRELEARNEEIVAERDRAWAQIRHGAQIAQRPQMAGMQDMGYLQALAQQQNMANPLAHAQMLQAMNQQLAAWGHCNCVPARHDMLLLGGV